MASNKNKFEVEISGKIDQLEKAVSESKNELQGLGKSAKGLESTFAAVGGVLAAAFAVGKIVDFAQESVELAAKVEGVKAAFDGLNDPKLLADLNRATAGTVSNLDLMQKAVSAVHLGIDKNQLATYFEFATKRAQETGQSVDYLVESIVMGVGRKSAMILDNLGISSLRLSEELKRGGTYAEAVGRIINEDMAKSGALIETATIKQAQLNKQLEDQKVLLGNSLLPLWNKMYKIAIFYAEESRKILSGGEETASIEANRMLRIIEQKAKNAQERGALAQGLILDLQKELELADQHAANPMNASREAEAKRAKTLRETIAIYQEYIDAILKAADAQTTITTVTTKAAKTVGDIETKIKELNETLAGATTNAQYRAINDEIKKYQNALESLTNIDRSKLPTPQDLKGGGVKDLFAPNISTSNPVKQEDHALWDKMLAMQEAQDAYNNSLWLTQNLTAGIGTAFADAIVSGEDFGQAMEQILAETLKQLIAMVAQAALLSIILSALGGGGFGSVFGSVFGGLTGGGGNGMTLTGVISGTDINLSNSRAGYQNGRK